MSRVSSIASDILIIKIPCFTLKYTEIDKSNKNNKFETIKAITVVNCNKQELLCLLLDDTRVGEFDEMFDSVEHFSKTVDHEIAIVRHVFWIKKMVPMYDL